VTGAGIQITAKRENGARLLVLRDPVNDRRTNLPLTDEVMSALTAWRANLPERLVPFHNAAAALVGSDDPCWQSVDKTVGHLRRLAYQFLGSLTALDRKSASDLANFLGDALHPFGDTRRTPSRIELKFDERDKDLLSLPIEYLPIRRSEPVRLPDPLQIRDLPSLQHAMNAYAGFSAIVIRRLEGPEPADHELKRCAGSRIPLKVIRNDRFYRNASGAIDSEVLWLRRRAHSLAVEEAWPDENTSPERIEEAVARCLMDPRHEFRNGEPRAYPDQIQHISCHASAADTIELREAHDGLSQVSLRLGDLHGCLTQLAVGPDMSGRPGDESIAGPIVFLNTCRAGAINPSAGFSLVELLRGYTPARAIVAPATYVHFPLAAAFARHVYAWLMKGLCLAEAVHQARWDLLLTKANPFGIVYALHGDADLRINTGVSAVGYWAARADPSAGGSDVRVLSG
jgi:hypothetical protein